MKELASSFSHRTFRDPAGSVEIRTDGVFRSVQESYAAELAAFLDTPLSLALVASGQLVSSEVVSSGNKGVLLRHPRVSFISYPAEWSPSLWLAAAELTLDLCAALVAEGWVLKDATPLNILFEGTTPVFVDVASIQRLDLTRPIWYAYGQFVRTFLLPMLAHSHLGWPLQLALTRRDGFEPEEIHEALPWLRRIGRPALMSVTLPVLLAKSSRLSSAGMKARTVDDPEITKQIILKTLESLRTAMRRAMPAKRSSLWSEYTETASHYSQEDHAEKRSFVAEILKQCSPEWVLDVGCNSGVYSRLAADGGAQTVSIDTDMQALDRLFQERKVSGPGMLPLFVDLAYPTPATGWENRENVSFLDRCCGRFDTVLMLAVIHHLLLNSQIPLGHIAALCSRIATQNLIIEWIPPTDQKFIEVLRGRDALYGHITEGAFRSEFANHFSIESEAALHNGRILFHMIKR